MSADRKEVIAKAIFNWLNGDEGAGYRGQPPFTFNDDPEYLEIGVDGHLHCRELAAAIDTTLTVEIDGGPRTTSTDVKIGPSKTVRIKGRSEPSR